MLPQVEHGDDVGVRAEAAHSLRLPLDSGTAGGVEAFGLDQGEGDLAVQQGIVGQIDLLLAALAQEPLDLVAAAGKGGGGTTGVG